MKKSALFLCRCACSCEINLNLTRCVVRVFLVLFLGLQALTSCGQAEPRWSDKTLVAILPSNQKKIQALQEAHQHDPANRRLENNLLRETAQARLFAAELQAALDAHFDYSEVLYILDSTLHRFKSKNYLMAQGADDQHHRIDKEDLWFLVVKSVESGAHGLVLCDQRLQQISRPFPSFYRLNRLGSFVHAFFNKDALSWRPLGELVAKMNTRLHRYEKQIRD